MRLKVSAMTLQFSAIGLALAFPFHSAKMELRKHQQKIYIYPEKKTFMENILSSG